MSLWDEYVCGAAKLEQLVADAESKVKWAALPISPGETPKAQILRAFHELRELEYGLVRATWYRQCGPYQYPHVHNAWLKLVKRREAAFRQLESLQGKETTPWLLYVSEAPIAIVPRSVWTVERAKRARTA